MYTVRKDFFYEFPNSERTWKCKNIKIFISNKWEEWKAKDLDRWIGFHSCLPSVESTSKAIYLIFSVSCKSICKAGACHLGSSHSIGESEVWNEKYFFLFFSLVHVYILITCKIYFHTTEKQEKASFPSVYLYEITSWIPLFWKSFNRGQLVLGLDTERLV